MPQRVLILCTGNSCRSQMAEALWRQLGDAEWEAYSAGARPAGFVHPLAIEVMRKIGLDLARATSKPVNEFADQTFDLVVTVCDSARESCPVLPGARRTLHWSFDDPAGARGTRDEQLAVFRRVRDEIRAQIAGLLQPNSPP